MKHIITVFALPQEIDELEQLLLRLKSNFNYIDGSNYIIDISLGISNEITDWGSSILPQQYFIDKFNTITKILPNIKSRVSKEILGCVSQRRYTWKTYQDCDYHIWLDTDLIFDPVTLYTLDSVLNMVHEKYPLSIITPEIVKIWDDSWDCLVNEQFINEKYGYEKTNNPFKDCGVKGDISLEPINNSKLHNRPFMKFAGGWFTCISTSLLNQITIPDSLGHYGWEDTLIMLACSKLNIGNQFKVKNLVVCENYRYRNHNYITNYIKPIDKKEEFRQQAYKGASEYLSSL